MALLDRVKGVFSGKKAAQTKAQAQKVVQKVDDQAEKLAAKDGVVGTVPRRPTRFSTGSTATEPQAETEVRPGRA